jgi:hypothetical protein
LEFEKQLEGNEKLFELPKVEAVGFAKGFEMQVAVAQILDYLRQPWG